jgi:hypothetical protein
MIRPKHIILRLLLVAIPILLAMAPAMAQARYAYVGESVELSVDSIPGDTYTWELYNDATGVNFATTAGNCPPTEALFTGGKKTGPVVHVTLLSTGTYFFKVTSQRSGCTMNLKVGKIIVEHPLPAVTLSLAQPSICMGQAVNIEANFTGTEPLSITYRITNPDGTVQEITQNNISGNPWMIPFTPTATGTYRFEVISVTDAFVTNNTISNSVTVTVNPKPASSRIYKYDPVSKKK